jgi:hypothetical protein
LDADGNKIFAYEMAMNKRVKSNMERLKRLDLLKFVPEKAPSPKKDNKRKKEEKYEANCCAEKNEANGEEQQQ